MRRIVCTLLCMAMMALPVSSEEGRKRQMPVVEQVAAQEQIQYTPPTVQTEYSPPSTEPEAPKERKYVALTFDDGPSGRFTRRLLEGLKEREVKATFFLCGYRLADYKSLAKKIYDQGHEIGLHGYSHENLGKMTAAQIRKELKDTAALLPEGCKPTLLRPPGGASGQALGQVCREMELAIINWSVDPRDWANHDAAVVEAAVIGQVQSGDIILLHDMCDCSVDAAFGIIDKLSAEGFQFVTVSELARIQGQSVEPGKLYTRFG